MGLSLNWLLPGVGGGRVREQLWSVLGIMRQVREALQIQPQTPDHIVRDEKHATSHTS